ncbi:MAG: class I SAM-dependent methyltransferase [bacterium]
MMSSKRKPFFCPPCTSETWHRFIRNHVSEEFNTPFAIYECTECGTKRTHPFLTDEQLSNYYTEEEISGAGLYERWRKKYKYIHDWINKTLDTSGLSILEIGSSSGNLLRYFKENSNCEVVGIELSAPCKHYSEEVNQVPVFNDSLSQFRIIRPGKVDLVIMVHLFEHIPDPVSYLKEVASVLKEKGYVYIEIPNSYMIDFDLLDEPANPLCIPFHSFIYNMASLSVLLERNQFTVIAKRHWSRKEDGGTITSSYAEYFRRRISGKFGNNFLSKFLSGLMKGVIRFFPNRYLLGYYYSKLNKSTTIAVLCRKNRESAPPENQFKQVDDHPYPRGNHADDKQDGKNNVKPGPTSHFREIKGIKKVEHQQHHQAGPVEHGPHQAPKPTVVQKYNESVPGDLEHNVEVQHPQNDVVPLVNKGEVPVGYPVEDIQKDQVHDDGADRFAAMPFAGFFNCFNSHKSVFYLVKI